MRLVAVVTSCLSVDRHHVHVHVHVHVLSNVRYACIVCKCFFIGSQGAFNSSRRRLFAYAVRHHVGKHQGICRYSYSIWFYDIVYHCITNCLLLCSAYQLCEVQSEWLENVQCKGVSNIACTLDVHIHPYTYT